jgi:hypothetical protein
MISWNWVAEDPELVWYGFSHDDFENETNGLYISRTMG